MAKIPRIFAFFLVAFISQVFADLDYNQYDLSFEDSPFPSRLKRQIFSGFCDDDFDGKRNEVLQQTQKTPVTPGPATASYMGQGGRIEMVEATIKGKDLDKGSVTNAAIVTHARSLGGPNDDAGHIIANRLGGSGKDKWNIFPQSKNINRGEWAKQEDTAYNIVQLGNTVKYTVILEYCNGGTRPTKIWYRWQYKDKEGNHCFTGDLVNPESAPSKSRTGRKVSRKTKGPCLGSGKKKAVGKGGKRSGSKSSKGKSRTSGKKSGRVSPKRKYGGGKKSSKKSGKSKGGSSSSKRSGKKGSKKTGSRPRGRGRGSSKTRSGSKKRQRT